MIARYLQWLITLETLACAALAYFGYTRGILGPFGVAAVMLGLPLAVRAIWVAGPILYARKRIWPPASEAPLSTGGMLRMMLREWVAVLRLFSLIQPFENRWMGQDMLSPGLAGHTPVILVHGYRCNRGLWWWMRRELLPRGHTVATLNLDPLHGDIDDYAEKLSERIEAVCAITGAPKVNLIGHSMGGLVILACLRRHGGSRIAKFISLGTPFRGSHLAPLGSGRSARQMREGNHWLTALEATPLPPGVEVTNILSLHDAYVSHRSAWLEGARIRRLSGVAHLEMPWSDKTFAAVCETLESPAPRSASSPSL